MFSGMLVVTTMAAFLTKDFQTARPRGRPISIIDVSAICPSEITPTRGVRAQVGWCFDYAIWARQRTQRPSAAGLARKRTAIIPNDELPREKRRFFFLSDIFSAGSPRKGPGKVYGVSLGPVTQRPSDLAEGCCRNCGTRYRSVDAPQQ